MGEQDDDRPAGMMVLAELPRLGGRPSLFTSELATEICERLAEGESLREICAADAMPNRSTVFRWLAADEDFRAQYMRAREAQADFMADEILAIADDSRNDWIERRTTSGETKHSVDHEYITRSRLRVDTRKWLMAKMAPKKYGERMQLAGESDSPLTVEVIRFGDDIDPPAG